MKKLFVLIFFLVSYVAQAFMDPCEFGVNKYGGGGSAYITDYTFMVADGNCCSPASGAAYFVKSYYDVYGKLSSTSDGYISIRSVQEQMCPGGIM